VGEVLEGEFGVVPIVGLKMRKGTVFYVSASMFYSPRFQGAEGPKKVKEGRI